jgi:hypothetical protein
MATPNPLDSFLDSMYRFYEEDRLLLDGLGLDTSGDLRTREWVDLGEYAHVYDDDPDGKVAYRIRVSTCALPAMFWRFDVRPVTTDGEPIRLETGSGTFAKYWPVAKLFAEGMIVPSPLPKSAVPDPT